MTIERITFRPEGARRAQTIFIENVRETVIMGVTVVVGAEVARDGETKWFGKGDTQRTHMIDSGVIVTRTVVTMNRDWAVLVTPDGEPA